MEKLIENYLPQDSTYQDSKEWPKFPLMTRTSPMPHEIAQYDKGSEERKLMTNFTGEESLTTQEEGNEERKSTITVTRNTIIAKTQEELSSVNVSQNQVYEIGASVRSMLSEAKVLAASKFDVKVGQKEISHLKTTLRPIQETASKAGIMTEYSKGYAIFEGVDCEEGAAKSNDSAKDLIKNNSCELYSDVLDTCKTSSRYYPLKILRCKGNCREQSESRICNDLSSSRTNGLASITLNCSMAVCAKNPVTVAIIDEDYGIVRQPKAYYDITELEKGVRKAVFKSLKHGFDFVFLSCIKRITGKRKMRKVQQVLFLPPLMEEKVRENNISKSEENKEDDKTASHTAQDNNNLQNNQLPTVAKPNINVIVLDSISRAHFHRIFPKTSSLMKGINEQSRHKSRILDFRKFQSLAPFTFVNVKSFMTGKQDFTDIKDRDIGFHILYEKLKNRGYQTMIQEDTCWYDRWGSILTSNRKRGSTLKHLHTIKQEWKKLSDKISGYHVDNFGLSHLSCFVLAKYGRTNMFNDGSSFCFDGKPLSAHFLAYATRIHMTQESTTNSKAQFTYTHLNIAHESTGKRACILDKHLVDMFKNLYHLNNTVTIIWSDHGAKTSQYSIDTLTGKFETFDAFLFAILPNNFLKNLGNKFEMNLANNQNAVVSAVDLHNSILFMSDFENALQSKNKQDFGLFTDKTWRQGCAQLPMRDYALCKCVNRYKFMDVTAPKDFYDVIWMAEFAIGQLNDKLNKQLGKSGEEVIGQRNCLWLQGINFRDVIQENRGASKLYVFDILVKYRPVQVFNVQILKRNNGLMSLFHWQRTSVYKKFDSCKDGGVSIELCICNKKQNNQMFDIQEVMNLGMFGVTNNLNYAIAENDCLVLLERHHSKEVISMSIVNKCEESFNIKISDLGVHGWLSSRVMPVIIRSLGVSITFVTTVRKQTTQALMYKVSVDIV